MTLTLVKRYKHHCNCNFLGIENRFDVYSCDKHASDTVLILRYGNKKENYIVLLESSIKDTKDFHKMIHKIADKMPNEALV